MRVEDNGETKLYNDAQVTISIGDENDQPPVFVKDLQRYFLLLNNYFKNYTLFLIAV